MLPLGGGQLPLGRNVRHQAAFQECDLVFEQKLAPFQAPKAQFVQFLIMRQSFYYFIEIAVLDPQHFDFSAYCCSFLDRQIHRRPRCSGVFSCCIGSEAPGRVDMACPTRLAFGAWQPRSFAQKSNMRVLGTICMVIIVNCRSSALNDFSRSNASHPGSWLLSGFSGAGTHGAADNRRLFICRIHIVRTWKNGTPFSHRNRQLIVTGNGRSKWMT